MARILLALLLSVSLLLGACATYRITFGWGATDLSWLEPGMEREKVEDRLGKPYQMYTIEQGFLAVYEYNRGYIPPAEKDPKGKLAAPVFFFTELITLGGLTYAANAVEHCQRGRLRVLYDTSGKTLAVKECPGKIEGEGCGEMQSSRRPSTLLASFNNDSSVGLDCDFPRVIYSSDPKEY